MDVFFDMVPPFQVFRPGIPYIFQKLLLKLPLLPHLYCLACFFLAAFFSFFCFEVVGSPPVVALLSSSFLEFPRLLDCSPLPALLCLFS
jgi:hypothetical protein